MVRACLYQNDLVTHGGTVVGYFSFLGFSPATGKGAIVLSNNRGLRNMMDMRKDNVMMRFVAEVAQVGAAESPTMFPLIDVILIAEVVLCVLLLCLTTWQAWQVVRRGWTSISKRWFVVQLATMGALTVVVARGWFVGLPRMIGLSVENIALITPDVALLAYALLGLCATWLTLRAGRQVAALKNKPLEEYLRQSATHCAGCDYPNEARDDERVVDDELADVGGTGTVETDARQVGRVGGQDEVTVGGTVEADDHDGVDT